MRTLIFPLLLMMLLASGCSGRGPVGSYCGPLPEGNAIVAITADAVDSLSALYPPGHTSIHLVPAKDVNNGFVQAFENGLRAKGFTLVPDARPDALVIAYTLDAIFEKGEKSAWYLQLRISDTGEPGKSIARAYTASGQPEAGQSRTEIEFKRSMLHPRLQQAANRTKETVGKAYDATRSFLTE